MGHESRISLADERRRPQTVDLLEVKGRVSALAQSFATDSDALHALTTEHEAALVHFKETLDALREEVADDSERLWAALREHEAQHQREAIRAMSFRARLRWFLTGR